MSAQETASTPDPDQLIALYHELVMQEAPILAKRFSADYEPLFSGDLLYGASTIDKISDWYVSDFKPTVNQMGEDGTRIWESLKKPDLFLNPKLLSALFTVIVRLYFPAHADAAAIIALIVVIQQLVNDDMKREASKKQ